MPLLTTSTRDLTFVRTSDPITQVRTIEIPRTARGDIASVAGTARLAQRIQDWLETPVGAYVFDPTFGNPMLQQLLRPGATDRSIYDAMVKMAEDDFLARQQLAAAQGFLSLDEQVERFGEPVIVIGDNGANGPVGTVSVSFTVYPRSGTPVPATAAFSAYAG